jgi:hypothetical protein
MKLITEYLSTKVKSDKIYGEFPHTPKFEDIINFLEDNKFEFVDVTEESPNSLKTKTYGHFMDYLNNIAKRATIPQYAWQKNSDGKTYWVRFWKPGEFSKEDKNFVYYCTCNENGEDLHNHWRESPGWFGDRFEDFKDFRHEVCEEFGFVE